MSTVLISVKGKGHVFKTAEDCKDLIADIEANPTADKVVLGGNSWGVDAINAVSEKIATLPVTDADFSDLFTGKTRAEIPPAVKALTGALKADLLSSINYSDNAFGPDGVKAFIDFVVGNSTLKIVNVNNTGLGPEGGQLLASGFRGFLVEEFGQTSKDNRVPCSLEQVIAGRSRLEDKGAIGLAKAIEEMKTLKVLRIPQSGITPKGMVPLAKALGQNPIEDLDFYDNNIGKKGSPAVVEALKSLTSLKRLNLGDCMIDTKGVKAILELIKSLETLELLDLSYDSVTDECVPALKELLKNNPRLTKLELNGNHFSADSLEELRDLLVELDKESILGEMSDNETEEDEDEEEEDETSESESSEEEVTEAMGKLKI